MSFRFRAVSRTVNASGSFLGSCLSPRKTHCGSLYQLHQLVPVRQFNIRRVITKKPSETIATQIASGIVVRKSFIEKQASAPLRYIQYTNDLERFDVEKWLSSLVLPRDTFWVEWSAALAQKDAGGLRTAEIFAERWQDEQLETSLRVGKPDYSNGGRKVFECTRSLSMPLLGVRTVVSYGYTTTEAYKNQKIARVSKLYKAGELDDVYKGTIASRKLLKIYSQAATYGFYPRLKVSMSNDQPGAQFQITLGAPEWGVQAISCKPTYIEALSAAVENYDNQVKKRDVKKRVALQATNARLGHLNYRTSNRALKYLVQKLQIDHYHWRTTKLDSQGPQWICSFTAKGSHVAGTPMIRKNDAQAVGTLTAVVRILQSFGFEAIDGFWESIGIAKNDTAATESREEEEDERAVTRDLV